RPPRAGGPWTRAGGIGAARPPHRAARRGPPQPAHAARRAGARGAGLVRAPGLRPRLRAGRGRRPRRAHAGETFRDDTSGSQRVHPRSAQPPGRPGYPTTPVRSQPSPPRAGRTTSAMPAPPGRYSGTTAPRAWSRPGAPTCPTATPPTSTAPSRPAKTRPKEHTSELQSRENLVCRLLLEKKKKKRKQQRQENLRAD